MTAQGIGYGCCINGHMNAEIYTSVLDNYLLPTIKYYKLKRNKLFFQQDGDSKHKSKAAHKWLNNNKINILEWPPLSRYRESVVDVWVVRSKGAKLQRITKELYTI